MKLNGNTVKPGNVIEHIGRLWTAVKVAHVKPGKGAFESNFAIYAMAQSSMNVFDHLKPLSA